MGWTSHPRRTDVLRDVVRAADARLDGVVPMDVTGVGDTFGDEPTLLEALQLRWHVELARCVERAAERRPLDRESAAVRAWCSAADGLPGTRLVLDHHLPRPALRDHLVLAAAVGRGAGPDGDGEGDAEVDPGAPDVGARLERLARLRASLPV